MRDLRRALRDNAFSPDFVKTVPRHGYRFVAPVEAVPNASAAPRRAALSGGVAVLIAVAAAAWFLLPDTSAEAVPAMARESFLRGELLLARKHERDTADAAAAFAAAVEVAPEFAPGWAALADAHFYRRSPPALSFASALEAVERALELDPDSARARTRYAELMYVWHRDFPAAERAFRRAIASDPTRAETLHSYAAFLVAALRFDEAITVMDRALAIDPLSVVMHGDLAWFYTVAGRYDDALIQCELLREIGPATQRVITCPLRALLQTGRLREAASVARGAMEAVEPAAAPANGLDVSATLRAYWAWRLGQLQSARARGYVDPLAFAVVHARLESPADALRWLKTAFNERSRLAPFAALYPELEPLRDRVSPGPYPGQPGNFVSRNSPAGPPTR